MNVIKLAPIEVWDGREDMHALADGHEAANVLEEAQRLRTRHDTTRSAGKTSRRMNSSVPPHYDNLIKHIQEIERAQLEMLGQTMDDPQVEPLADVNMLPHMAAPVAEYPVTISMPYFHSVPQVTATNPSKGMVGVPSIPQTMARSTHPYPKIAVAQIKKEWEPNLAVKRQLFRQDSGMTSWKLVIAKLSPSGHSLLVFPPGRATTQDMDYPVRDPEVRTPLFRVTLRIATHSRLILF